MNIFKYQQIWHVLQVYLWKKSPTGNYLRLRILRIKTIYFKPWSFTENLWCFLKCQVSCILYCGVQMPGMHMGWLYGAVHWAAKWILCNNKGSVDNSCVHHLLGKSDHWVIELLTKRRSDTIQTNCEPEILTKETMTIWEVC